MFLVNSRLGLFSATSSRFAGTNEMLDHYTLPRHPFSQSYGVNLPSSLAMVHSSALGFSPCLPVSVYGTDACKIHGPRFFSTVWDQPDRRRSSFPSLLGVNKDLDLPGSSSYELGPAMSNRQSWPTLPCYPTVQAPYLQYGNINPLPIAYAFRPRLRPD